MANRSRPWLALLVSALVHVVVALVLIGHAGSTGSGNGAAAQSGHALMVRLVAPGRVPAAAPQAVPPRAVARAAEPAKEGAHEAGSSEPEYFGVDDMTEQPVVIDGLVDERLLIVPGMDAQGVSLQVWIGADGSLDRVELESELPEQLQQLVLAEFAKVRFLPGRIGNIAVHSRVSMRILVDNAVRT